MSSQVDQKVLQFVGRATFGKPVVAAAATGNCTIVTTAIISSLTLGALTIAAQPDCCRTLRVALVDANASITGATVTIVGQDQNGEGITDVIAITGAGNFDGAKAFSKVVGATWALVSGTVTTTDDTVAIGYGPALGLPAALGAIYDRLIKGTFDGLDDLGTFSKTYGLYTPAGTMNSAKVVEVAFLYKLLLKW